MHYAKGMCNGCYHLIGRDTYAWVCEHKEKKLYAKGRCHRCYVEHLRSGKKKLSFKRRNRRDVW